MKKKYFFFLRKWSEQYVLLAQQPAILVQLLNQIIIDTFIHQLPDGLYPRFRERENVCHIGNDYENHTKIPICIKLSHKTN